MAEKIETRSTTQNQIYQVLLTYSHEGIVKKVNISNVGFGISQVLPIITQALLLSEGEILILEQPEIHLHPKAQSMMADFLLSMALSGKRIIVETHSDHLITRIRRRIAENENIHDLVSINFLENTTDWNVKLISIKVDEYGVLSVWPNNFCSDSDEEFRAIIRAQNIKRRKERECHNE